MILESGYTRADLFQRYIVWFFRHLFAIFVWSFPRSPWNHFVNKQKFLCNYFWFFSLLLFAITFFYSFKYDYILLHITCTVAKLDFLSYLCFSILVHLLILFPHLYLLKFYPSFKAYFNIASCSLIKPFTDQSISLCFFF